jgi:hypothetical protein
MCWRLFRSQKSSLHRKHSRSRMHFRYRACLHGLATKRSRHYELLSIGSRALRDGMCFPVPTNLDHKRGPRESGWHISYLKVCDLLGNWSRSNVIPGAIKNDGQGHLRDRNYNKPQSCSQTGANPRNKPGFPAFDGLGR